jgi:uncharacterized membrane protein
MAEDVRTTSTRQAASPKAEARTADRLHDVGTVVALDQRQLSQVSLAQRLAARLAGVYASLLFLSVESVFVGGWVVVNSASLGIRHVDPPPFSFLTLALTFEVLVLSACVLVAQRQEAARAERRAQVMLHLDTVVEEKTSLLLRLLTELRESQGLAETAAEVAALQETTDVTRVVEALDEATGDSAP